MIEPPAKKEDEGEEFEDPAIVGRGQSGGQQGGANSGQQMQQQQQMQQRQMVSCYGFLIDFIF